MIFNGLRGRVEKNYPLRFLNTWKIGGPGEWIFWPQNSEELKIVVRDAKENGIPIWLIGRGSNVLISDEGLPGITVVTTNLENITWLKAGVKVEAGYPLSKLAREAGERGLSGLEFARGIPGTVGGAIIMNAGAHGGEIAQRVKKVKVLWHNGVLEELKAEDLEFSYRNSSLKGCAWVLEAEFLLNPGNREEIREKMNEYLRKRSISQPLDLPNAGSVFRNPPGDSAGRLIETAGWKGKQMGGVQVSQKHANFIVNLGNGTARDVISLINDIQKDIEEKYGVKLVPEINSLMPGGKL